MRLTTNMRIIAGRAKGLPLACVPGHAVRPTPERMRIAMFNILGPDLPDATVLDLFAGTGSLGLEALSRGASHCVFVESGYGALQALRQNLANLGLNCQATVLARDVFKVEEHLAPIGRTYNLIFAAPPYAYLENPSTSAGLFKVLGSLASRFGSRRVSLNIQHSAQSRVPDLVGPLHRLDHRRYGNAELSRFHSSKQAFNIAPAPSCLAEDSPVTTDSGP